MKVSTFPVISAGTNVQIPVVGEKLVNMSAVIALVNDSSNFTKGGTAYIGGDQTGNTRGAGALDVQSARTTLAQVASGLGSIAAGSANSTSSAYSLAFGINNTASGNSSSAFGLNNLSSDTHTTAVGYQNTASGVYASAFGYVNTASGIGSSAFGYQNTASGTYASAVGYLNGASNIKSSAFGYKNTASGIYSLALGSSNTASGVHSSAFGASNSASSTFSTAIGYGNVANSMYALALGYSNSALSLGTSAIGRGCTATNSGATAIGNGALANIAGTTNICGPIIARRDAGEGSGNELASYCGVSVVLMSQAVNLVVSADQTITLPAGCMFYPDEAGIILTGASALTISPQVRFGITGTPAALLAASNTSLTAVGTRTRFTTLLTSAGQTSLTGGVTSPASAVSAIGRFYWKGLLIESQ